MSKKNYLTDETVMVQYVPSFINGISDKKHPLYGGLSSNASIGVTAPLVTDEIDKIFTQDELDFLGEKLNEDLSRTSDFWKEYRKDQNGMPQGIFPIFLKKEGMHLTKRNPLDYIRIRILEHFPLVAKSQEELKYNRAQYRFVLIEKNQLFKEDIDNMSYEKRATELHSKYEKNDKVLAYILKTFNRNVTLSNSRDFLVKETWKLVKSHPKQFVATVEDELLSTKVWLDDFLRYKLVTRSNNLYFTLTGDPLRLDGETNDYTGAANYLSSGAGQEMLLELQAKVKLMEK